MNLCRYPVKILILIWLSLLAVSPVLGDDANDNALVPGVNEISIEQDEGLQRHVLIHVPRQSMEGGHPVVFGFHGAGGKNTPWQRRFARYVNQRGMISVSPQGAKSSDGVSLWNFKQNSRSDADDVGLVRSIVEILQNQGLADMDRIYATGASSGGLMAYRLAVDTDLFAAIAPTKSGMAKGAHEPQEDTPKISVMQVIGDQDQSFHGLKNRNDEMYSLAERIEIWTEFSQCGSSEVSHNDEEAVTVEYRCAEDKELVFMVLKGVGHDLGRDWTLRTDSLIMDFFLRQHY